MGRAARGDKRRTSDIDIAIDGGGAVTRALVAMADDRNLTACTYNEMLADEIHGRLPAHARVLSQWLAAISR